MKITNITLSLVLFFSTTSIAQTCFTEDFTMTTPSSQFVATASSVIHTTTQLVWKRCVYGQVWNTDLSSCTGDAVRVDWAQALKLAQAEKSTDLNAWRIPNVKELASLVEKSCVDPAINGALFPNAPAEDLWTSTTSANNHQHAWAVTFSNGRNNQQGKNVDKYIRLVKFAE